MNLSDSSALRRWFSLIIASKRNTLIYATCGVGIPAAFLVVWLFRGHGGIGFAVFGAVVGLVSGYLWGVVMWVIFVGPRLRRLSNQALANSNGHES